MKAVTVEVLAYLEEHGYLCCTGRFGSPLGSSQPDIGVYSRAFSSSLSCVLLEVCEEQDFEQA